MQGLTFELEGIYFLCFRKPTTTSLILSYPLPPFTTIRGLIANCLGMPRLPDYKQQLILQNIRIGIQPINPWEIHQNKTTEMCKLLKLIEREAAARTKVWNFPSAPMFREFLVTPRYRVFLIGEDGLLKEIYEKLQNPERPLYLGQSDDMVDILNLELMEIEETVSKEIHSIVKGIYEGCEVVKLPYKFSEDGKNLEEITISIPQEFPLTIKEEIKCYRFDEKNICVY